MGDDISHLPVIGNYIGNPLNNTNTDQTYLS